MYNINLAIHKTQWTKLQSRKITLVFHLRILLTLFSVIRGEILNKEVIPTGDDFGSADIKYTVKVKRIYKGEEFMPESGRRTIDIMGMAFCDPELKKGEVYLISGEY